MHKRNTRTSERRASKTGGTTDAVEILHKLLFEGHPARLASLEEEKANLQIARKIYDLRAAAGLSQRELAKRVGTTAGENDECLMTNDEGNPNDRMSRAHQLTSLRGAIAFEPFELRHSSFFRHSSFVIRHWN